MITVTDAAQTKIKQNLKTKQNKTKETKAQNNVDKTKYK
jgi:hypothetical protein